MDGGVGRGLESEVAAAMARGGKRLRTRTAMEMVGIYSVRALNRSRLCALRLLGWSLAFALIVLRGTLVVVELSAKT